ncbi:MAG TPA: ribosome-associated translation inhibitor RaiA [Clostridia bacterium]|nr:ribosome-associated translation inhibitor RaiA [Clostridia bacterium]
MQIVVRGKNIEVTDALKSYVERKLGKLEKYFDQSLSAQVTMSVERGRHIVEVTVPLDSILLRGEEESTDMYASVDLVSEKIERQIEKYRTRILRRLRREPTKEKIPQVAADEKEPGIVKVKKITIRPMTADEAVMQMNLIGHDFFVYADAENGNVSVVYRRKDGNYGVIETRL